MTTYETQKWINGRRAEVVTRTLPLRSFADNLANGIAVKFGIPNQGAKANDIRQVFADIDGQEVDITKVLRLIDERSRSLPSNAHIRDCINDIRYEWLVRCPVKVAQKIRNAYALTHPANPTFARDMYNQVGPFLWRFYHHYYRNSCPGSDVEKTYESYWFALSEDDKKRWHVEETEFRSAAKAMELAAAIAPVALVEREVEAEAPSDDLLDNATSFEDMIAGLKQKAAKANADKAEALNRKYKELYDLQGQHILVDPVEISAPTLAESELLTASEDSRHISTDDTIGVVDVDAYGPQTPPSIGATIKRLKVTNILNFKDPVAWQRSARSMAPRGGSPIHGAITERSLPQTLQRYQEAV